MAGEPWYEKATDWALSIVSPTRAAVRRHWKRVSRDNDYREAYELALRLRGYKAANPGKNATTWHGLSNRTADGEILSELPALRAKSRLLNRDNPIASGITNTLVRGVIGTGLRPQATTGSDAKDDALEAVWKARANRLALADGALHHGAAQRLRYGKRLEDGEVFLKPAVSTPGEPLWIETIEADRVCTPNGVEPEDPQGRIVDGVEKDRFGRVVAYWILKQHPGDVLTGQTKVGAKAERTSAFSRNSFERVEARFVCHDRSRVTRPGQTRGVPITHAVIQELHDLDLLIVAALKRSQIAACLAVFLTSDASAADLIELTAEQYGYQLDQKIEPGMIFRLNPGEEAQFLNPSAGLPDLKGFIFFLAQRIGAAIGLSPQSVLKAWETLSYSAARTIKIEDGQTYKLERTDYSTTELNWEWRLVHEDELLRGNEILLQAGVTIDDLDHVEWVGDEERWVDPQADANATETMLRLGLTTFQRECARLGYDWQENVKAKIAAEKFEMEERARQKVPAASPEVVSRPPGTLKLVNGDNSTDQGDAAA